MLPESFLELPGIRFESLELHPNRAVPFDIEDLEVRLVLDLS